MKVRSTKFEIGDALLIRGSQLQIERVLTVSSITVYLKKISGGDLKQDVYYAFEESQYMHHEDTIVRKVEV